MRKPIAPYVDGISGAQNIANMFSSRFKCLFNKHSSSSRSDFLSSLRASLSNSMLLDTSFSEDDVYEAINQLHSGKADANRIVSEHLKLCSSVIALPLSLFFTAIVCHGHMPKILRDSTFVPVLKNNKDASVSGNYRPIALSSTLSKVLERLLLTLGAHAQRGLRYLVCVSVCVCVCVCVYAYYSAIGNEADSERYQPLQYYKRSKNKMAIFLKRPRSSSRNCQCS